MKKIVLLLFSMLLSNICFAENEANVLTKNNSGFISNKRGLIEEIKDNGALGYICPKWSPFPNDCEYGKYVFFDIHFNKDAIDFQKFTVPKGYSFYAKGSYTYKIERHKKHTVRRIELRKKDKNNKEEKITLFRL